MSSNIVLNAGSGGQTVSTEDNGSGVQLPRTKILLGASGTDGGDVTATNPFPVQVVDGSSHSQPAGDAVSRPIFVKPGDGTSSVSLKAVNAALDETATTWQETAAALFAIDAAASAASKQVPLNVVSTAAPWLKVSHFNSTNQLPAGDSVARSIFVEPNDGTNQFKSGSATNLAATSGVNAMITTPPGQFSVTHAPAANTQATASKAAGGAGVRNVAVSVSGAVAAGASAPTATTVTLNLRDGATGAGSVLASWIIGIEATAGRTTPFCFSGLNIPGTANTAMTLEFGGAGGANTFESVTLTGYQTS